ncbi:MAG: NADH:ubiquinone reductase (Na(+)-transporting) subunit C [Bacteroidales bacterium]|jgi:Na+-transporting NADH:ubiquinone oxidoreductase subunit C|nr:NADH:ubiquinone reductase (Na(+)-transporting) subunit C [Bacteroidales bacterium]
MNKESNSYTIIFSIILILIVGIGLTLVATLLAPRQKRNLELEKKTNILKSINITCDADSVELLFDKYIIKSFSVNIKGEVTNNIDAFNINLREELLKNKENINFPIFVAKLDGYSVKYIFSLSGKGLWGEINGFVSTDDNFITIYGIIFNHVSETPGLGGDINTPKFQSEFFGKKLFNNDFSMIDLKIIKNRKPDNLKDVDALSGATLTSNGVQEMIENCMTIYKPFIINHKNDREK